MLFPHSEHWMNSSFHFWRCMLVNAVVTSRLDYGNALLYSITTNLTDKLQRVHNTAARLIARTKKMDHITPVLIRLHWLPVEYRSQYKLIRSSWFGSSIFDWTCETIRSIAFFAFPVSITSPDLLWPPFRQDCVTLWNNIPLQLKTVDSLSAFKSCLKTYHFKQAFRL